MKPPPYVLKEGSWFACFARSGWIEALPDETQGVFLGDVRILDLLEVRFDGMALPALWGDESENHRLTLHCSNASEDSDVPPGALDLNSERRVCRTGYVETLRLTNHVGRPVEGRLEVLVNFDFADVAEVRGLLRDRWDREIEIERPRDDAVFAHYQGPGGFQVSALLTATRAFEWEDESLMAFPIILHAEESFEVELRLGAVVGEGTLVAPIGEDADAELDRAAGAWTRSLPEIETDDEGTNELLAQSADDLRMLWTWTGRDTGFFAAGIPLLVAPFGREGLLTSLGFLPLLPEQAQWTLAELARHRGTRTHPLTEEEPGKIPHEIRRGERSRPDVYPDAYASIDPSLLFPMLLNEYLGWSGDLDFVREMEPVLRGVLEWCATCGDTNGDGFLDHRGSPRRKLTPMRGEWKEGERGAVTMGDGSEPAYPIAMVESQGYARDALLACERMFRLLEDPETAENCRTVADALKASFKDAFWWPEEECFALGVDGHGRRIDAVGTNQGRCLMSDLIDVEQREAVVRRLMKPDVFTGLGLRTLSTTAVTYSPSRHQRGAVWPHDSALIAYGMHRRGFRAEGNRIASGLLRAGGARSDRRLPALFLGLSPEQTHGTAVDAPSTCRPQALAAASPFLLLRAVLGIHPDALSKTVTLKPDLRGLPFTRISVRRLRVAGGHLSFDVEQDTGEARVTPVEKEGDFAVQL